MVDQIVRYSAAMPSMYASSVGADAACIPQAQHTKNTEEIRPLILARGQRAGGLDLKPDRQTITDGLTGNTPLLQSEPRPRQ